MDISNECTYHPFLGFVSSYDPLFAFVFQSTRLLLSEDAPCAMLQLVLIPCANTATHKDMQIYVERQIGEDLSTLREASLKVEPSYTMQMFYRAHSRVCLVAKGSISSTYLRGC